MTHELIGSSPRFQSVLDEIDTVGPVECTVLLRGETGTGKEVVARAIHESSERRHHRFVALNCASVPAALLESELFGHERGAFTGAVTQTTGRFQMADRGTLFLDEIGDLPLELQPKLLRVLQEREFERLGSGRTQQVDVRVIAATNQDLLGMVRAGRFRADLYYRLNVFPIELPPLRDRREDIPVLVDYFVQKFAERHRKQIENVPEPLLEVLTEYDWPGNIRELQNFIERSVIMTNGTTLCSLPCVLVRSEQNCRNCREGKTGICLNVNGDRAGGAFGYVDMGGWIGGQADYVMAPYADFNLLKFPDKDQALDKIEDLTLLSDIFPTGYDGAVKAGVTTGSTVYVAGAGPVGLACAASCQLLGAAVVIVGDMIPERLAQGRSFGCETIDLRERAPLGERIAQIVGVPEVDSAVDCVGFEAKGQAEQAGTEQPAAVLNSLMAVTRAGGAIGIPGLYVTDDPGAKDANAKQGILGLRIGLGWAKSHNFGTGQCPVLRYNRQLMMAILHNKVAIAKAVNVTVLPLEDAPRGYNDFDKGAAKKFVLDPHGIVRSHRAAAELVGVQS